ncbi:MAG: hypothetical protein H0Z39_03425 [Peptococcaceae bacterium]|nr:hypothetical protein [Peptococcaceae bacterium]
MVPLKPVKTILAVVDREFEQSLMSADELDVLATAYSQEDLLAEVTRRRPEVVVVSADLQGSMDPWEVARQLRTQNARVVFLAGVIDRESDLVAGLVGLAVYDILFDPVTPDDVIHSIMNPAGLSDWADVVVNPTGPAPHGEPEGERKNKFFFWGKRKDDNHNGRGNGTVFVSHPLVTIWNPSGRYKNTTALNLAVAAAKAGLNTALVNCDLMNPELDVWFDIPQTSMEKVLQTANHGAGIMTMGSKLKPELVPNMLKIYGWGVYYLPAGNKLDNLGTPDLAEDPRDAVAFMEKVILAVYQRNVKGKPAVTIINAGTGFEYPPTFAALKNAGIVVIPLAGERQEAEIVKRQLHELARLDVEPQWVELLWELDGTKPSKRICRKRLSVTADPEGYLQASHRRRPYCLTDRGSVEWREIINKLLGW